MRLSSCPRCGSRVQIIRTKPELLVCETEPIRYREERYGKIRLFTKEGREVHAVFDSDSALTGYQRHLDVCPYGRKTEAKRAWHALWDQMVRGKAGE